MFQEDFIIRLAQLRTKKGVSARDMSLSLGRNVGYINLLLINEWGDKLRPLYCQQT